MELGELLCGGRGLGVVIEHAAVEVQVGDHRGEQERSHAGAVDSLGRRLTPTNVDPKCHSYLVYYPDFPGLNVIIFS